MVESDIEPAASEPSGTSIDNDSTTKSSAANESSSAESLAKQNTSITSISLPTKDFDEKEPHKRPSEALNIHKYRSIKLLGELNPSNKLAYHDMLRADFLSEFNDRFCTTLSTKLISWNLCQCPPSKDLPGLLKVGDHYADLYIFTFQETISLKSFTKSKTVIDDWCGAILGCLPQGYRTVQKSGLVGLTTIIIAKEFLAGEISDIKVDTLGLGYLNWYNKGCISIKFSVGKIGDTKLMGTHFQTINLHLVHGETQSSSDARLRNLQKIGNSISMVNENFRIAENSGRKSIDKVKRAIDLSDIEIDKLSKHSISLAAIAEPPDNDGIVFISGDFNSRFYDVDRATIAKDINTKSFNDLFQYDEVCNLSQQKVAFQGLSEGSIDFPPTYKVTDDNTYDLKRRPAYTDRIMYCGPSKQVTESSYGCSFTPGSDHLPVHAEFKLKCSLYHPDLLKVHCKLFDSYYSQVINSMRLLEIEPYDITCDCCSGFTKELEMTLINVCDETLIYNITEVKSGFFQLPTFRISDSNSMITRKSEKKVKFVATPSKMGIVKADYIVSLKGFTIQKHMNITLNVKTIIGIEISSLEEQQYQNIMACFDYILHTKNKNGLISHLEDVEALDSLSPKEEDLLKEITIRTVTVDDLEKNIHSMKRTSAACPVLGVVYIWLKYLPQIDISESRGKKVFSRVIDLIKFLGMQSEQAYEYFGFLFSDQYEILDYLESSVH